jgi:hypothetical protein
MASLIVMDAIYEYRRNQDDKFWEGQRADWDRQRQTLLDRIQAPSLAVYKALESVPAPPKDPKPEVEGVDQI